MNLPFFIARRLIFSKNHSFTDTILKIAILAISVSMAVMILSTAMINGFKKEINEKIFGFWGHIHVTDANVQRNFETKAITVTDSLLKAIQAVKQVPIANGKDNNQLTKGGIAYAHRYTILPGLLEHKSADQAVLFKGIDQHFNWAAMDRFLIEGRRTNNTDTSHQEILLSKVLARKLEVKVNQKVIISFLQDGAKIRRALKVVGIYNTGLEEYDKRFVLGDQQVVQQILGWQPNMVSGIEIFCQHIDDINPLSDYLYQNVVPIDMYAESIQEKFPSIFEWLKLQDINEKTILILMTIVAIINMATALMILILNRTRMIGVLKSLGANLASIRAIFLYNAAYLIIVGLIIGNILGIGLALLQKKFEFIKLDEQSYYLTIAPIQLDLPTILIINLGSFLIILACLFIPSLIIGRINPIKALRFD